MLLFLARHSRAGSLFPLPAQLHSRKLYLCKSRWIFNERSCCMRLRLRRKVLIAATRSERVRNWVKAPNYSEVRIYFNYRRVEATEEPTPKPICVFLESAEIDLPQPDSRLNEFLVSFADDFSSFELVKCASWSFSKKNDEKFNYWSVLKAEKLSIVLQGLRQIQSGDWRWLKVQAVSSSLLLRLENFIIYSCAAGRSNFIPFGLQSSPSRFSGLLC